MMKPLLALLMVILTVGCNGPNSKYEEFGNRVNTRAFGHKYAQPEYEDEWTLGPGDVISIQIANNTDLDSLQPILADGTVQVSYVGPVKVAGLTTEQIQSKIQLLLSPYIRGVSVVVTPQRIVSKRIYVFTTELRGGIRARALPLQGDYTVLDLVADVGGIDFLADDCHLKVIRGDPRHPQVLDINVYDMFVNGYTAGNIQLRPDDIVYFQPSFFARIAQTLYQATLPLKSLSLNLSEAADTVLFIQTGRLPRRRRGTGF
ncbi:MAG TPA: hypothetical protein ENK43_07230 [Planctomycetes bacterium]|nr:hypothetical protein [Planctomycetota bacterium]